MAIDMSRVIQTTVDAVLEGRGSGAKGKNSGKDAKSRGLTMPRAFLIGAGVVTAGRLVAGSRGQGLLEGLQERLIDYEQRHFGNDDHGDPDTVDQFDEEEPEAEEDEEPEAEEDEDFDEEDYEEEPEAEEDEEPEAEEDEDFDEEPEAEEQRPPRRRARSGSGSGGRRRVRH